MKKFLIFTTLLLFTSCNNRANLAIKSLEQQLDSLHSITVLKDAEIARKNVSIDSLQSIIGIKEIECQSHEKKLSQYKELVDEYKTVLYAIVGEDGMYHYTEIDYD